MIGEEYKTLVRDCPIVAELAEGKEVFWINEKKKSFADVNDDCELSSADVRDASDRLRRFAPYFMAAFPETRATGGIIESPLRAIPKMKEALEIEYGVEMNEQLYIKLDSHLAVSGSIKARGGIYEVLCVAEQIAMREGGLSLEDDYSVLHSEKYREIFSKYSIAVMPKPSARILARAVRKKERSFL